MSDDTVVSEPAAPPQRGFAIGQRLGDRYEIRALLGQGGMGAVYRAHDGALGDDVALKVVRGGVDDAVLRDEVRLAQKVTHANVCRTYDLEVVDGHHLVKMEYVAGRTLAARIAEGRVPVGEAIAIARGIAAGLAAAHRAGVVHRDLKPANVMLAGERVVLMDFGLASQAAEATTSGTPGYMAPEQLAGADVDARADLYALGCVLYELLAGEPVFAGTAMERIARHASLPAPDVRAKRSDAPRWLARATALLLAKAPARRPQGAAILARGPRSLRTPAIVVGAGAIAAIAYLARSPAATAVDPDDEARALLVRGRELVAVDPLAAVATVAPLAGSSRWLEVRGIVEAARPAGIPFAIATPEPFYDVQLSPVRHEAVARGRSGAIWLWDLDARRGTKLVDGKGAVARYAPDGRIVIGHGDVVTIIAGAERRDVEVPWPGELEVGDGFAFVAHGKGPTWRIDLAHATAAPLPLAPGWTHVAVAPDGHRVALFGAAGCAVADASAIPTTPVSIATVSGVGEVAWSPDGNRLAARTDKTVAVVRLGDPPQEERLDAGLAFPLAFDADDRLYAGQGNELHVYGRDPVTFPGRPGFILRGPDVMAVAQQGEDRIRLVFGIGGYRDVPARSAILGLAASPSSPYLVAATADHLLVWHVDDIAPHRVITAPARAISAVGEGHVLALMAATVELVDATSGRRATFDMQVEPMAPVSAAFHGEVAAILDKKGVSFLGPGEHQLSVDGDYDGAYMLDDDHALVIAFRRTLLADLAAHKLAVLHDGTPTLAEVYNKPWLVLRLADGAFVRRDLVSGGEQTLPAPLSSESYAVLDDGSVAIAGGYTVSLWERDGTVRTIATMPGPIDYLLPRGRRLVVATGEPRTYVVAVDAVQDVREPGEASAAGADLVEIVGYAKVPAGVQLTDRLVGRSWLQLADEAVTSLTMSPDRTFLYVRSPTGVAAWNVDVPRSAEATAKWVDAMTNARIDPATDHVVFR